jgi:hypothetical protein
VKEFPLLPFNVDSYNRIADLYQRFWKDSRQREFHEHASLVRFTVASDLEEERSVGNG